MNPFFIYLFVGIAFIIMTVLVIFLQNNLVTIACLFFLMVGDFFCYFYFQKKSYQKTEIEQIQYVNHQAEDSFKFTLRTDAGWSCQTKHGK